MIKLVCPYCKSEFDVTIKRFNQAKKANNVMFCTREHANAIRRMSADEKAKAKRDRESTPEYKAKKARYDELRLAVNTYGEFAESAIILKNISRHIEKSHIKIINKRINKTQNKKRQWHQLINNRNLLHQL